MHEIFRGRYCDFSKKKFSSNVVERFLKSGSKEIREEIVDELIRAPEFAVLLQDGFGNYVIQNSLVTAPPLQAQQLMDIIQPLLPTLRRNVRRKWERLIKSVRSRQEKKQRESLAAAARARVAAGGGGTGAGAGAVPDGAAAAVSAAAAVLGGDGDAGNNLAAAVAVAQEAKPSSSVANAEALNVAVAAEEVGAAANDGAAPAAVTPQIPVE